MSKKPLRSSAGSCELLHEAKGLYFDFKHPRIAPTLSSDTGRRVVLSTGARKPAHPDPTAA